MLLVIFNLCHTIEKYAIDFNENKLIELKNNQDSFASAANYLKKMGWEKNEPCFIKVNLKWLGPITPIGGTILIIGWLLLLFEFISPYLS